MKTEITNKDYEAFARIDPYIKTSWDSAAVVGGCIIIDDKIAIPSCLQRAVLSRLHHSHPGQEAMVDTEQLLWWPRIHRDIVNLCKNCRECTQFGKNLKWLSHFKMYKSLPLLNAPNEEVHLDFAGPLSDKVGSQIYILVAIDRYSKYSSSMLTKSTGANKLLKLMRTVFLRRVFQRQPERTDNLVLKMSL